MRRAGSRTRRSLPRIQDEDPEPEESELVLTIVEGRAPQRRQGHRHRNAARAAGRGDPVPRAATGTVRSIKSRSTRGSRRYEESMRERGYYQARVRESHAPASDGWSDDVTVTVEPGPHVSLVFAGDPLPDGNRDALVPIRAERSVDQDLLEDASLRIENALREQGYRAARAPYTREEKGGELVLTFTIARGRAASRRIGRDRRQREDHARRSGAAPADQARRSVRRSARRAHCRGHHGAVSRPRFRAGGRQAGHPGAARGAGRQRDRIVRSRFDSKSSKVRRRSSAASASKATAMIASPALQAQMALQGGKPFYRPQLSVDRDTHRARLPQPGLPERLGHLAADVRRRSASSSP